TKSSGRDYFLGLRGNRVFISTPGDLNNLTAPLKDSLDDAGMPAFHYKRDQIPIGDLWAGALRDAIADVDLVLAFISASYWNSEVCVAELKSAIERWERHQLLIVTCIGQPTPPMPEFLSRYQAKRIEPTEEAREAIVEAVRARFSKDRGEELASFA